MANLDDLFRKPSLPSSKRKHEPLVNPNASLKAAKLTRNGDVKADRQPKLDEVQDEDDEEEAGPELPPDENEEGQDDEEGRFFGGGITSGTADVLDFMDQQGDGEIEKFDKPWLRKRALNFEKRISKNAEMRAKFEGEPQKFMESEADLDADLKSLSILSEHPELYEEFSRLGCVQSLVNLLAHENTDIAIAAIEIISELTDEDIEATSEQWDILVEAMLEADLLDLLVQNFQRFDEENQSDRSGVYHALSVLENLASKATISERICKDTAILPWLLKRIKMKEATVGQNKQYSAEILAILLQTSSANRERIMELEGVDTLLELLSVYRKRDPVKGTEEEEYVENLFDCVICIADDAVGKRKLVEAEGLELCLIMVRDGKLSKMRALRLVDHALGGPEGGEVCEKLVELAGLKTIFGLFMKKQDGQTTEHLLCIMASLLRLLPGDSASRIRALAKFVEKDYEKISKLVQLRRNYSSKVDQVNHEISQEKASLRPQDRDAMVGEWESRRLDAGLYCLQTIDIILAWLVAEDDGAKQKIKVLLSDRDESLLNLKASIQSQLDDLGDEVEEQSLKGMLTTLHEFLI